MRGMRPALIALALVSLTALPLATGGTYYTYLGVIIGIYGIVAVGLNILSGYAGQFSLGHAAFMAMGAYTTALITKALSGSPVFYLSGAHVWLGILCGTTVAALSGILLAIPALRVRGRPPDVAAARQRGPLIYSRWLLRNHMSLSRSRENEVKMSAVPASPASSAVSIASRTDLLSAP